MPQLFVTTTRTAATRVYRGPAQCNTSNLNELSFGLFSQVSATLHLQAIISKIISYGNLNLRNLELCK